MDDIIIFPLNEINQTFTEIETQICVKDGEGNMHQLLPILTGYYLFSEAIYESSPKIDLSQISCSTSPRLPSETIPIALGTRKINYVLYFIALTPFSNALTYKL